FEKFVIEIYRMRYPYIQDIKPQGQKGDGGNDGYVPGELVLQCYAPENINAKTTIAKIQTNFERAKNSNWNFKEWHFVVNDDFKGIFPEISQTIDKLNVQNQQIEIKLIDTKMLLNQVLNISKTDKHKVYNLLYYEYDVVNFNNLDALFKAVDFIVQNTKLRKFDANDAYMNFALEKFNTNVQEKIKINIKNADFIKLFGTCIGKSHEIIEEYKNKIDNFEETGRIIKEKFMFFREKYDAEESLKKTIEYFCNNNCKIDQNSRLALWIVIAYFFDICDIGDKYECNGK
ncbi:hypothetical protein LS133_001882, partial [Campylobacter jejuni]|nr:hypothetical protein [Campylobacter jejuni]